MRHEILFNAFSCFVIGTESHLIQCAGILLQRGHQICGIISSETLIEDWARKKGIPLIEPSPDLASVLSRQPFDYLFSIVHPHVISSEILALARKGAINFHDGPLPRYAGMNATSWAIINQETTHGVTWHVMTAGVDKGDILKQHSVDIVQGDTALTLNAKCYEAGIDAFAELVDELTSGRVEFRKQNLVERTYFAKYKRPPAACTLTWSQRADEITALVRALDFGPYTNPLGLPKLVMGEEILIALDIDVLDVNSQATPGTITAIDDDSLKVSTASNDVALGRLLTINGQPLSVADFAARFGVREGDRLAELDKETGDRLTILNGTICRHEAFWVNRLIKWEPFELPYANRSPTPAVPAQCATAPMPVPAEFNALVATHDDVANRSDILAAAFAAFLARISGNYAFDLGFSYPALQQEVFGFERFVATHVPLRVEFAPSATLRAVLDTLQAQLIQVKSHETYARDTILRYPELSSIRAHGGQSPWSVVVELVEGFADHTLLPGRELAVLFLEDGRESRLVYDTAVLEKEDIVNMQRRFVTFLRYVIADSNRSVADIPVLTEIEYHKLTIEWNDTRVDYPQHLCLHQLFEAQAERTPNAVAVSFEGEDLTYGALNRRANQLAHHLQRLGVGPEVLIGVFMERSLEMVIGLYAILKAGGAYVPLDPEYPPQRVAFMLKDTQVPVLLTQERLVARLPKHGAQVICLDSDWATIAKESGDNPISGAMAGNLAYVIYTSGSTGRPKGVMNCHRGICNRLLWMQDAYQLAEDDRVLQKTPFSFDVSVWEFFWPLLAGARLIVARPGGHKDSAYLVRQIVEQEITTLHFVPSMLQVFLEDKDVEKCHSLKRVICSGEALSYELQKRFLAHLNAELHNLYGPTEAAVDATHWRCQQESDSRTVPIGRPIANTRIYILDRHMQPVPIGVSGELHIGGVQVARGYLNRAELTAEKFIPDPFSDDPKARLYKTGDLARYLPDGNIEFLGRLDHQVKVRGFRIELGEIESVLNQHPAVREAAVLAREDVPGDIRLVAYAVSKHRSPLSISELRDFLKEKLPEHMVPAAFVLLEALPLTPNGKVDRRNLPPPEWEGQTDAVYAAPQNELEEIIAGIWQELLHVETVGVHDNIFDLGGHSLLIVRAHRQLCEATGRDLSITDMFRFPTVRTLTQYLSQVSGNGEQTTVQTSADRAKARREAIMRRRQHTQNARRRSTGARR